MTEPITLDAVAVRRALSELGDNQDVGTLRFLGEGWDSIVYLVDESLVLRFPKSFPAARALETELRLLPYLHERVHLAIPRPTLVGTHPHNPAWLFMGYPRLGGIELTAERFRKLTCSAQARAMQDLAAFLSALHTSDLNAVRLCGVSARNLHAEFVDVFARSEAVILPLFDRVECATFAKWSGAILADPSMFAARSTLIHGDLSPEHIFYDGATQRICGIIDFGDCAIADPDYDLMYLLEDYGRPFVRALLRYYEHPDCEGLLRKLEAFQLFDAARYVLFGHARADSAMIRDGLVDLRQLLHLRSTHGAKMSE